MRPHRPTRQARRSEQGLSLLELIIAMALLSLLVGMAVPVIDYTAKRQREVELKASLRTMRAAIDAFQRTAIQGGFSMLESDRWDEKTRYPKKLEYLVEGMKVNSPDITKAGDAKTIYFLREIPYDPMTKSRDWGMRSTEDDPDSDSWGGENIYDVFTKSNDTALNGTPYKKW